MPYFSLNIPSGCLELTGPSLQGEEGLHRDQVWAEPGDHLLFHDLRMLMTMMDSRGTSIFVFFFCSIPFLFFSFYLMCFFLILTSRES